MVTVYLAGPIKHVSDDGVQWREQFVAEYDVDVLNPLDEYNTEYESVSPSTIVNNDLAMIDKADCLIVNWKLVPTAGTPMEIFYANRECDIPVYVVFDGDDEDLSPWVQHHSTVYETVAVAMADIKS